MIIIAVFVLVILGLGGYETYVRRKREKSSHDDEKGE